MKKLLILAAIIVAGVAANAAAFKWTAAKVYAANGTDKYTGTATIYAYTTDVSSATKVAEAYVVAGTFKSDAAGTATGFTAEWGDAVVDTTYNFYMVIEDGDKAFDSSAVKTASGKAIATGATSVAFGNMTSYTQNASNWAAVPEPTSGLLMLLGVAGLALRRRRA